MYIISNHSLQLIKPILKREIPLIYLLSRYTPLYPVLSLNTLTQIMDLVNVKTHLDLKLSCISLH